jgi:hypothetical protein
VTILVTPFCTTLTQEQPSPHRTLYFLLRKHIFFFNAAFSTTPTFGPDKKKSKIRPRTGHLDLKESTGTALLFLEPWR